MKLQTKKGQTVEVVLDSKKQVATVEGRIICGVRDNRAKLWNCDILTEAGNKTVKEEVQRQFCKKVDETGKKRK